MTIHSHKLLVLVGLLLLLSKPLRADDCESVSVHSTHIASHLAHQFDSGAQWNLCWHIDSNTGLTLSNLHYSAPQQTGYQILEQAALAQILFKYDQDTEAQHWLSTPGLGGKNLLQPEDFQCQQTVIKTSTEAICSETRYLNPLTSVRRSESLKRHQWTITAWSKVGSYTIEQAWHLSEDGEITPTVRLGGSLNRFTKDSRFGSNINLPDVLATNASVSYTWRLHFNIAGTPLDDVIEEIEFVPLQDDGVKRKIETTTINTESQRHVKRSYFRAWQIRDSTVTASTNDVTRIGYLLDPQASGFSYISSDEAWASFDFSATRYQDCELLASENNRENCGQNLGDYVNGESLTGAQKIVWFSLARQFLPKQEDFPNIVPRQASFKLIPFDWSASTPFTPLIP